MIKQCDIKMLTAKRDIKLAKKAWNLNTVWKLIKQERLYFYKWTRIRQLPSRERLASLKYLRGIFLTEDQEVRIRTGWTEWSSGVWRPFCNWRDFTISSEKNLGSSKLAVRKERKRKTAEPVLTDRESLTSICNKILQNEELPNPWTEATIVSVRVKWKVRSNFTITERFLTR